MEARTFPGRYDEMDLRDRIRVDCNLHDWLRRRDHSYWMTFTQSLSV